MSVYSSLSLWSSIKILSNPYASKRKFTSVPYVAAVQLNEKQNEEMKKHIEPEIINLKMPEMLATRKISSSSISNIYSKVQTEENTLNNKASQINIRNVSTFPDNCFDRCKEAEYPVKVDSLEEIESVSAIDLTEARNEFEKEFGDWDPEMENSLSLLYDLEFEQTEMGNRDITNPNWVPSVKPWTLEELNKVNELYNTMEENINKIKIKNEKNRKKKHTLNKNENEYKTPSNYRLSQGDSEIPCCRQFSSLSVDEWYEICCDCNFSTSESDSNAQLSSLTSAKTELTKNIAKKYEENYYKSKLAQLYLIENGC